MFELETLAAFGAGAALMAMAPVVRKLGNQELGDSMGQAGRTMAKSGVKIGLVAVGTAEKVAKGVAKSAAEVAETFVDLVKRRNLRIRALLTRLHLLSQRMNRVRQQSRMSLWNDSLSIGSNFLDKSFLSSNGCFLPIDFWF